MIMRRRDFLTLLGGATAAWPLAARAKQGVPVVGYLGSVSHPEPNTAASFLQGLREGGYVEGQNVEIEYRWADGHGDRLSTLAADLVRRPVATIATYDTASALAAKAETTTIPIVFATGADPVRFGLIANLARPSGNVTGVTFLANTLGSKRLGLLRELVPTASAFGFLIDPTNPNAEPEAADMQAAAKLLGYKLLVVRASTAKEIDAAFTSLTQQQIDALAVAGHAFFGAEQSQQLAELALRHRLPTIYAFRSSAATGGLMSYGGSQTEAYRQQGILVARILKGEKSADLPVQQVTRFELVINLKAAMALGLAVPPTLLAIADEVIE
jgi:putative tryptophan/tyrosine transport system substrate-binding protein